jgi:hypothetical protein
MRTPSDKRLEEMPPILRHYALAHILQHFLDLGIITARERAEGESLTDLAEIDIVVEDLSELAKTLVDHAEAITRIVDRRRAAKAKRAQLIALRNVSTERGHTAGEVANARRILTRKEAQVANRTVPS